jgi:hypothetical protein
MNSFRLAALSLAILGAAGCGPVSKTLKPVQILNSHHTELILPGCPVDMTGAAGQEAEVGKHPGEVVVGFERSHSTPCTLFGDQQVSIVHRGAVRFDLASIPKTAKFTKARLLFKRGVHHAVIGTESSNDGTCLNHLMRASTDWSANFPADTLIPGTPLVDIKFSPLETVNVSSDSVLVQNAKTFSVDVTPALQAWINQGEPNNGFVLVGSSEIFPENSNQTCFSWYGSFVLDIVYDPLPPS